MTARSDEPGRRGRPAALTDGRRPQPADRGVRHLPGTRGQWVIATAQTSGLLLSVRAAENTGRAAPPDPLRGGRALRAWGRVARSVLDRDGEAAVPAGDLDVVAGTADTFGRLLCGALGWGAEDPLIGLLRREAAVYRTTPEALVAQIARVHGVLTSEDEPTARLVWDAGAG